MTALAASVPAGPVAPAPRLLMWDIDGTLVQTGGVANLAYAEAFTALTGVAWQRMPHSAGGPTGIWPPRRSPRTASPTTSRTWRSSSSGTPPRSPPAGI